MNLDPTWVPVVSGLVGGSIVWIGSIIKDLIAYRREDKRRVQDERQKILESRKIAYYKFIDVFSTHVAEDNVHDYFQAVLEAAEFGDIILSTPLKARPRPIQYEINSLDTLLSALIFMKSTHYAEASQASLYYYARDLETLRSDALTPFMNELMNRLRQSKVKEIKKKDWRQFWR
jgi:hypothetical protein